MSADRRRWLTSFGGTIMLLVIVRWCWVFVSNTWAELHTVTKMDRAVLFDRMQRLRPPALHAEWLARYVYAFVGFAAVIAAVLWVLGAKRWWRERVASAPEDAP